MRSHEFIQLYNMLSHLLQDVNFEAQLLNQTMHADTLDMDNLRYWLNEISRSSYMIGKRSAILLTMTQTVEDENA